MNIQLCACLNGLANAVPDSLCRCDAFADKHLEDFSEIVSAQGCAELPTPPAREHGKNLAPSMNSRPTKFVISRYETRHGALKTNGFAGLPHGTHLESVTAMALARSEGFTLIELMLVVGLIAVLAAATVPSIVQGMRQFEVATASQQVASTIRLARYQAVGKNMTVRVRFDYPATGQYQILDASDADVISSARLLLNGAAFSAVSGDIEIDSQGRVTALAGTLPATVTVANSADSRTISISRGGRVELP
jgi:prepilin-type N-terminal cleavage/methylation domain-containing protein